MELLAEETYMFDIDDSYLFNVDIGIRNLNQVIQKTNLRKATFDLNETINYYQIEEKVNLEWSNNEYLFDTNCKFYPDSGYPILRHFFTEGDSLLMDEEKSRTETENEKKQRWLDNYNHFMEANKSSKRTIFETDEEKLEFIKSCEESYKVKTIEHIDNYVKRGYEGNVDERRWFRFAKYLQEKGYTF
ncbi:hypothetical protein [Peribacillus frigoritolerans]|uniref:hypothetical protein n=1 Tax=Peribacillus frigoritolerans TaxID=450367 RepID=UPI00203C9F45|nr:hypothetical protein [Peribacillus frigoritolerans]MCM3167931.1 hypothetical protein [Peribacillus frigoritolerans]